jgi:hypothetical protein
MIEISYDTKELKSRIYNEADCYDLTCLIKAIAEIAGDMFDALCESIEENSESVKDIEYAVSIEGENIECNYVNTTINARTLSGTRWIETPNGPYCVSVGILIKLDTRRQDAHIKRVSLDVCSDSDDLKELEIKYSIERDLSGGISVNDDSCMAEVQKIVDEAWNKIMENETKRN